MADKAPTGIVMMLKALGVNPDVFTKVSMAVSEIAQRMERIEGKCDAILDYLKVMEDKFDGKNGSGKSSGSEGSSGQSSGGEGGSGQESTAATRG